MTLSESRLKAGGYWSFCRLSRPEHGFRLVCALALALFCSSQADATETFVTQPAWPLAYRAGTPSCWARFPLREGGTLCVPQVVWRDHLRNPRSLNGKWQGRWRTVRRLHNDPGAKREMTRELRFIAEKLPEGAPTIWENAVHRVERLREETHSRIAPEDHSGALARLLINQHGGSNTSAMLQRLGFVHLVTAAGIHLYVMAMIAAWMLASAFERIRLRPELGLLIQPVLVGAIWLMAWALCGARPGMVRPWLVIGVRWIARRSGFRWTPFSPLLVAIAIDLAIAFAQWFWLPEHPWAPGRLIYALAVGGGLMATAGRRPGSGHFALALGSWVLVALFEAGAEGWVAPATPLLNLITLPAFCMGVYPLLLSSVALNGVGFRSVSDLLLEAAASISGVCLNLLVEAILTMSWAWLVSPAILAAGMLAAAFALASRARFTRFVLALLLARAVLTLGESGWMSSDAVAGPGPEARRPPVALKIEQLDVGQGDAALIYGEDGKIGMIDTGSESSLSDHLWLKLLARRGIQRIHWLMLTHLDEDHAGGLFRLARLVPIDCVWFPDYAGRSEKQRETVRTIRSLGIAEASLSTGCVPFAVQTVASRLRAKSGNSIMSAIVVPLRGGEIYFSAGDADFSQELRLLPWFQREIQWLRGFGLANGARILKISHHGSRFSSASRFLREVRPDVAWVSSGAGNTHGHPTSLALRRFERLGIPVSRTDREGFLSWSSGKIREKERSKQKPAAVDDEKVAGHP